MPVRLRVTILLATVVIGLPHAVRAQNLSLDTTFQAPLFTLDGVQPYRVFAQANGQFLVYSGYNDVFTGFDLYNNVRTGNLLRFNADGSLDTTFVLDPALYSQSINALDITPSGQYVVGTIFVSSTGASSLVYRLNADGSLDKTFNPGTGTGPNQLIRGVTAQADGKVLVGGEEVVMYNGVPVTELLRLNTDGSVDTTFNVILDDSGSGSIPPINGQTYIVEDTSIQLQSDGKIIIAGGFTSVNGVTEPGVARLNTDGSLDTTFVPSGFTIANYTGTYSYEIRTAAIQPDGKIVLGGRFNQVSNNSSQPVVRLNTDGSLDTSFTTDYFPSFHYEPYVLRITPSGSIVTGNYGTGLEEFNNDGTLNTAFANNVPISIFNGLGRAGGVGALPNGQIVAAGGFDTTDPAGASGIFLLNMDGSQDTSVQFVPPQSYAPPFHVALRSDGTVLAAGYFTTVAGQQRAGLAILKANGSLDAATLPVSFVANSFNAPDFVVQPDDHKILLFGYTPSTDPSDPENINFTYLRLNADLSVDTTLTANSSVAPFTSVLYQPGSGYLLSSGYPDAGYIDAADGYPGDPAYLLHRLSLDGSPDANFVPGIDTTTIYNGTGEDNVDESTLYEGDDIALAVQPDGKILFQYFDNTKAYRLVRLNADGSLDGSFQIGSAPPTSASDDGYTNGSSIGGQAMAVSAQSNGISGALVQSDGRILVYGDFATYNGQAVNGFARLNANGTLDASFSSGTGPQGPGGVFGTAYVVTNAQELSNGQLLIVGSFQTFNGVAVPGIARLNANGSVDTSFTASGVVAQQVSIGPEGRGNGGSSLAPVGNGTYLLTGNYTTTNGTGAGTFFRLFSGVSTTPVPVAPVVPSNLPAFFNGAVPLSGGFYYLAFANGNPFGYYNLDFYPYLYHSDLGFEYVIDAQDGKNGIYLYDFASKTFFYTSPSYPFPYLYDFTLKTVLYYFPDVKRPGHYTSNPRYFYNFDTKKVITK